MSETAARLSSLSRLTLIALAAGLAGCSSSGLEQRPDTVIVDTSTGTPTVAFYAGEYATGVPAELLMAIAHVETGLQMVEGEEEFEGMPRAFGVMGLRGDNVERGAELAGLTVEEVQTDRVANVLAAAHVMAEWADEEGIDRNDIDAWAPVVARYSGIEDEEAAAEYVHRDVYGALGAGIEIEGDRLAPMMVKPLFPEPAIDDSWRHGDGSAVWTTSPNYSSRSGADPEFVVIHTCEGSYTSCWSWLSNSASGVSAHYVVNETGSEVRQLVDEVNKAWHIAANYDCDNNGGFDCWRDGKSMNTISVGIEHAGYASQSSWNSGLISRSAELTCGITDRWDIPRDGYHIVGHGQMQPWNRSDPGANWPWTDYLSQVQVECGDISAPTPSSGSSFVIDSNNGANDMSSYYVEKSGNWWASANVAGYYNTGYWVAPTSPTSDPASFWFENDKEQCYKVEAWWSAASDRYSAATFIGWDPNKKEVGRASVDQRYNGAKWNHLGDWTFPAGWNRVLLSRWASTGSYVIADAVRLTPSSSCK